MHIGRGRRSDHWGKDESRSLRRTRRLRRNSDLSYPDE